MGGRVLTYDGTNWTPTQITTIPLMRASCASASFCVAIGGYDGDPQEAFTYNGSTWSSPTTVETPPYHDLLGVTSVSCTSPTFCVAVDNAYNEMTYNGTSWSAPQAIETTPNGVVAGLIVSCASSTFCVALGYNGSALTYDGTSWSTAQELVPQAESIASFAGFTSVDCLSSTYCAAVTENGNEWTFNGAAWTDSATIPLADDAPDVEGLSCATPSFCAAGENASLANWNGSTWSISQPDGSFEGHFGLVACPDTQVCLAFGEDGGVFTYIPSAPASKPSNTSPPIISGTTTVGQNLTSSTGAWSGTAPISYSYQWQLCTGSCSDIGGATSSSYLVIAADVGAKLEVVVTATNTAGSAQATSSEVGPIAASGPTTAQITAALSNVLTPSGKAAKIAAIVNAGGCPFSFTAPAAGKLVLDWYATVNGKQTLIASVSVVFHQARKTTVKITLKGKGRKLLKASKTLKITASATFTPAGGTPTSTTKELTIKR
ncbi:MAG: hypothetical protein ACLP8S_04185 [Solirubrobacteraceae bacterium]